MILLSESNGIFKNGIAGGLAQSYGDFTNLSLGSSGIINPIWRVATGALSASDGLVVIDTCVNDANFLDSAQSSGRSDALQRWFSSYQKLLSSIVGGGQVPVLLYLPNSRYPGYSQLLKKLVRELSEQFNIPYLDVEDALLALANKHAIGAESLYLDPSHPLEELMYFIGYHLGKVLKGIEKKYLDGRQVQPVVQQHFYSQDISRLVPTPVTRKSSLATMEFAVFEPGKVYVLKADIKFPCRLRGVLFNGARIGSKLSISTANWRVVKHLRFYDNDVQNPVDKLRVICRPIFNSECLVYPGDELILQVSSAYQESELTTHCFGEVGEGESLELHSLIFESLDETILIGGQQLKFDLLPDLLEPFGALGPLLKSFLKYRDVASKLQAVSNPDDPWFN